MLDPPEEPMPVLEPVSAQKLDQKKQLTALPGQPEDTLETEVLSLTTASTEGSKAEETGPEGAQKPGDDLEAEMNEEVHIP